MSPLLLELQAIRRRFGSTVALDGASLSVRAGTVHAVLGENGAGKTTLMRIAYGMVRADAGHVKVAGVPVRFRSPSHAIARGLGMVHQHFSLVPSMTVAENVALMQPGGRSRRQMSAALEAAARRAGISLAPHVRAGDLDVSSQQRLEILKALAADARVLILDEPTSLLPPPEADRLLSWIRQFAHAGGSIVLITHKLREALRVADDITVLRHGRTVLSSSRSALDAAQLLDAILGTSTPVRSEHPASSRTADAACVIARSVFLQDARGIPRIRGATFDLFPGEIVGIAAVEGSGYAELIRALAGRLAPAAGELHVPERIGFIPQDRLREAIVEPLSLVENLALRGAGGRRGRMDWGALTGHARQLLREHDIRAAGTDLPVGTLSGGNQQRLVIARELEGDPPLVVAENPSRGLDVRAAMSVLNRLCAARDGGAVVVLYSSDLDELLDVATRVLVVFSGEVHEVPPNRDIVGRAMLGAA